MKSDFGVMTSEQKRTFGFILLGLIVLDAVQYFTRNKILDEASIDHNSILYLFVS